MYAFLLIAVTLLGAEPPLTTGEIETVGKGFMFTEGPVCLPDGKILFSDIPADTIFDTERNVFRNPSGQSNGLTLDNENRLIAAEHANRRVSRTEADGSITVLAETFEGKKLNSPNDVVVRKDGILFFTDPPYGLRGGLEGDLAELDFAGVYAILEPGNVKLLARDFKKPNGLALSPDEKILYVADTEGKHIRAFDLAEDASVSNDRVLCDLPGPDGIKVDTEGNIWATAGDGVRVIRPDGTLVETIEFPGAPANCGFCGPDGKTLFVTARTGIYKVGISIPGILPGKR